MESHVQNPSNGEPNTTFPQFDIIPFVSDHHYAKTKPAITSTSVQKNIMKEWKILQNNNLPNSIYIRVFEERIDLLRAVIIGAAGTPYHDGLFFFDVAFPPNYPNKPPLVSYKSFGMNMNPNLYANGYVCLSLLNTWSGPKWDSTKSTMLQVLISLQGLVLNEKPFFNEPVYTNSIGVRFDKYSRDYNDNVFVLCCKTMVFLLRNPPKGFEGFVMEHFRNRGGAILTACKAYMHGFVRVGEYTESGVFIKSAKRVQVSKTFLRDMNMQYPLVVRAFSDNDSSVKEFLVKLDQMMDEIRDEYTDKKAKGKAKKVMKLYGVWKKFLGLNKCAKSNGSNDGDKSS